MRRPDGPSVALGAAAIVAIAALVVAGKMLYGSLLQRTTGEPEVCCKAPVEVIDADGQRLGCVSDAALASCGALDTGDRVTLDDGRCTIETDGMSAGMRVLAGVKLDLNTVSADELTRIDAVGPQLAAHIITERTKRGRFTSVDELRDVPGIGSAKLSELQKHLEIRPPKGVGE